MKCPAYNVKIVLSAVGQPSTKLEAKLSCCRRENLLAMPIFRGLLNQFEEMVQDEDGAIATLAEQALREAAKEP